MQSFIALGQPAASNKFNYIYLRLLKPMCHDTEFVRVFDPVILSLEEAYKQLILNGTQSVLLTIRLHLMEATRANRLSSYSTLNNFIEISIIMRQLRDVTL